MKTVGQIELLVSTTIGGHPVYQQDGFPALIKRDLSRFRHILGGRVVLCHESVAADVYSFVMKDRNGFLAVQLPGYPLDETLAAARITCGNSPIYVIGHPELTGTLLNHADLGALHVSQYFARLPGADQQVDTKLRLDDHSLTFRHFRQTDSDWEPLEFRAGPCWAQNRHTVWRRSYA